MTTIIQGDFPFEEYRDENGDYFDSADEAMNKLTLDYIHIWSVTEASHGFIYGPPHHTVNVLGFIGTQETHDGNTYYEETLEMG